MSNPRDFLSATSNAFCDFVKVGSGVGVRVTRYGFFANGFVGTRGLYFDFGVLTTTGFLVGFFEGSTLALELAEAEIEADAEGSAAVFLPLEHEDSVRIITKLSAPIANFLKLLGELLIMHPSPSLIQLSP
ncbi:MAG: hypothetical protein KGQ38_00225 [Actinomycetales bacterium]|nr:hypothetical protein [Actinomycetales bacterium]